ncbi:MAG: FG-GAP-like repeat-containing protein [Caldilineaceae bacterium]
MDFGEDVTGFDSTDVTVTNGAATSVTGGPQSYTVSITPSGTNDVTISIPASAAQDGAGNQSTASNSKVVSYSTGAGNELVAFVHGADTAASAGLGTSVWTSLGDGTFTTCQIDTTGFDRDGTGTEVFGYDGSSDTFFVDANNDNLADIVHISENDSNSIRVYFANGDGTFATAASATTTNMENTSSQGFAGLSGAQQSWMADVNNDGNIDYIFSGDNNQIHSYFGNGDGTFVTTRVTTALSGQTGLKTSGRGNDSHFFLEDINADLNADLVGIINNGDRIQIWTGNGDGTFNPTVTDIFVTHGNSSDGFAGVNSNKNGFLEDVTGDDLPDYVAVR